jgi:hypothetical protein
MLRVSSFGWTLVSWLLAAGPAAEPDFAIDLEVKAAKGSQTVHAQTSALGKNPIAALGEKPKPRVTLQVKASEKVTVKWTLRRTAAQETANDMLVHFYVVKIPKLGEPPPSKLDKDSVVETALTMDFKAKDKSDAELSFAIEEPGFYLLRLETIPPASPRDDPVYFAALDLIVQK